MASHLSLLVTGSRNLSDPDLVCDALEYELSQHTYDSYDLYIGDCNIPYGKPRLGADRFAWDWWLAKNPDARVISQPDRLLVRHETPSGFDGFCNRMFVFRADWYPNGALDKSAGPKRNSRLVPAFAASHGPHFAWAFWNGELRGTFDTMKKLRAAGLGFEVVPC
jgi:hypothetical protein